MWAVGISLFIQAGVDLQFTIYNLRFNSMGKIPSFAGKSSLSLTDLQALADAVPAAGVQVQVAPGTRGRVQYGLAQYHVPADECAGEVAVPDAEGMIAGVLMDAEGEPYIEEGVMHLPAGAGTGGGGCHCGPAFYDDCDGGCIGLIRSVEYENDLTGPRIDDGHILLPLATTYGECPGVCGGVQAVMVSETATGASIKNGIITLPVMGLKGVMTVDGPRSWGALECAGMVRMNEADASNMGVQVEVVNGYLRIYVDRG